MTSSDADDGRNGPKRVSQSPAPFITMSPLPPDMSPITPATRSVAASVVHENHTSESHHNDEVRVKEGSDNAQNDGLLQEGDESVLPNKKADALDPMSVQNDLAGIAPLDLNTNTTTASVSDSLQAFSNDLGMFSQAATSMPLLASTPHSMSLMMALAQLSASQQFSQQASRPPPSSVNPAQVSLPNLPSLLHGDHDIDMQDDILDHVKSSASVAAATPAPLESFAKIEFADSVFQMTTYAVIIGRDQKALEQARRDERRAEEHQRRVAENEAAGLPPPSPPRQVNPVRFSKSYVSEEGGMLGPESDGEGDMRPFKRKKLDHSGSQSNNSQQQQSQHEDGVKREEDGGDKDKDSKDFIVNRQYVSHTPGAAAVDLASLRPSPDHVPFIGIHSPGPNIASKTKAISREHLRIQYNSREGVFEAVPLHKNGFFCEDIHYSNEPAILRSGDRIQIKDVEFAFIINGVSKGKTGAEEYEDHHKNRRYSEGGKEMSFDFESSHAGELQPTSSDEEEDQDVKMADVAQPDSDSELSEIGEEVMPQVDDSNVVPTIENDAGEAAALAELEHPLELLRQETQRTEMSSSEARQDEPRSSEMAHDMPQDMTSEAYQLHLLQFGDFGDLPPMPPKKRGPGRPPKNGIMSKREERLRKKLLQEHAKKTMPQPPLGEPPIKRKVGRPRKHPRPEDDPERPEKRKYKPRKPKGENGEEISDGERPMKEKRREKPKTPPLELRKEDFTEDQLQKPNKNYGVLIDEVLTEAPGEGLTLKQIYKRIQKRYPYYYFVVDTKGWESSVRHNLIGNDAFVKNAETHLWRRVPGIELDAGKKRKAPSPDQAAAQLHHGYGQQLYQQQMQHPGMYQQQHMVQHAYQPNAMTPQGYPPNVNQHMPQQQLPQQQYHQPIQQLPQQLPQQQNLAGSPPQQQPNGLQPALPNANTQQQVPQGQRPVYAAQPSAPAPAQLPGYGPQAAANMPVQIGAQGQSTTYSSPHGSKPPPAPTPPTTNGQGPTSTPPVNAAQTFQQHGQPQQPQAGSYTQQQQQQQQQQPQQQLQAGRPVQPGQSVPAPVQYNTPQQPLQQRYPAQQQQAQQQQRPYQAPGQVPGQAQAPLQPQPAVQAQVQPPVVQAAQGQQPPGPPAQLTQPAEPPRPHVLEPLIRPEVLNYITSFKRNVLDHLSSRTSNAELVTLSVINRGLGLTEVSMCPESDASVERIVLGVFTQTKDKAGGLNPGLVTVLKAFKTKWVGVLGTKLGNNKAEMLLLSVIDRFLGFSERTVLAGSEQEKKEYEQAENMLIPQLKVEVTGYQTMVANGGLSEGCF